ncbi:MAG: cupin domain-containing protein [Kiloniellaceae bacterium]
MSEYVTPGKFAAPPDKAAVAADWRSRGYSCGTFVDPPGRRWEDFVHDRNELVTVVEGRLEMEVAGRTVTVGPGDEVFIPRGARHSVRNVHDDTSVWLYGYD